MSQSGPRLLLAVEDSGPGIPTSMRDKVFEAGYTTHAISAGGWVGPHRGLGLSICRAIVEAAGEPFGCAERRGGGARFEIELPIDS